MTLAQASAIIGTQFAVLCGIIAWLWVSLNRRVEKLADKLSDSEQAVLSERVTQLTGRYNKLHKDIPNMYARREWVKDVQDNTEKRLDAHAAELKELSHKVARMNGE